MLWNVLTTFKSSEEHRMVLGEYITVLASSGRSHKALERFSMFWKVLESYRLLAKVVTWLLNCT